MAKRLNRLNGNSTEEINRWALEISERIGALEDKPPEKIPSILANKRGTLALDLLKVSDVQTDDETGDPPFDEAWNAKLAPEINSALSQIQQSVNALLDALIKKGI